MLHFFRRIRKSLMSEPASPSGRNMTSKYFLYAVGEITLVVIGILIALQINTWNQKRLNGNEEQRILNEVMGDMERFKDYHKVCGKVINEVEEAARRLLIIANSPRTALSKSQIDKDLNLILKRCYTGAGLSYNIYDVLMGGGQMGLLSSRELRVQLAQLKSWMGVMIPYEEQQANFVDNQLSPYLNKYVDKVAVYDDLTQNDLLLENNRFENSYQEMLEEREFHNLLAELIKHTNPLKGLYFRFNRTVNTIDSLSLKSIH